MRRTFLLRLTAQEFSWISPRDRTRVDAPVLEAWSRTRKVAFRVVIVPGPTQRVDAFSARYNASVAFLSGAR